MEDLFFFLPPVDWEFNGHLFQSLDESWANSVAYKYDILILYNLCCLTMKDRWIYFTLEIFEANGKKQFFDIFLHQKRN